MTVATSRSYPTISLNLWEHKRSITIQFSILFFSACVLPNILYYTLVYGTNVSIHTSLTIITSVIGIPAIMNFGTRCWRLFRYSRFRPVGSPSRWAFDYFHWNFLVGIAYLAVLLSMANQRDHVNVRLISLTIPLIMLQVTVQFLIRRLHICCPLRRSSQRCRFQYW